jgi:hypothetical protein
MTCNAGPPFSGEPLDAASLKERARARVTSRRMVDRVCASEQTARDPVSQGNAQQRAKT